MVTGGSRGLGESLALSLSQAGADVAIVARNQTSLSRVTERLRSYGHDALSIVADLADEGRAVELVDEVLQWKGTLDILVNNAGIVTRGPAEKFTRDDWTKVIHVNLDSTFFMAQAAGRVMIKKGRGKIINIASINSVISAPNLVSYAASKGGVVQMTKALAVEWARYNVQVNAILPGYFPTDLNVAVHSDVERYRSIAERIPAKRWGSPEDLHGAIVFLASSASDYVSGISLPVDGGYLCT